MSDDRNYRVDEEFVEELRDRGENEWLVEQFSRWLDEIAALDRAIGELRAAFADVKLGDGTGLREGKGMDDYEAAETLADLRATDEKEDWQRITHQELTRCYAAPWFMDSRGFVFHLPAFLIAELDDQFHQGFIDHLVKPSGRSLEWMSLLSNRQNSALADVLEVVSKHPDWTGDFAPWDKAHKHIQGLIDKLRISN